MTDTPTQPPIDTSQPYTEEDLASLEAARRSKGPIPGMPANKRNWIEQRPIQRQSWPKRGPSRS